jgi:hemoglobin
MTDADLQRLVDAFYARVRDDALLGPVFNGSVDNWPEHLQKLGAFWSSVMRTTGRYKGSPMAAHVRHATAIRPEMFDRWLALWRVTASEELEAEDAAAVIDKAERIAESLKLALYFRLPPSVAPAPYKSTPVFDEKSLPAGLRREHSTKAGVWGVIRVLEGRLLFERGDERRELAPGTPAIIQPEEKHRVELIGPMRMQVDFYDVPPPGAPVEKGASACPVGEQLATAKA